MIQFDDHIFQMGWNHQLVYMYRVYVSGLWWILFSIFILANSGIRIYVWGYTVNTAILANSTIGVALKPLYYEPLE